MRREDHDKILQETVYGTGGIPKPEVGAVSVGKSRRRNQRSWLAELFSPKKVRPPKGKPKQPGFFSRLFSSASFRRKKGIDGF